MHSVALTDVQVKMIQTETNSDYFICHVELSCIKELHIHQ